MIIAAQDKALNTNNLESRVSGENLSTICRLGVRQEKTVAHMVSECLKFLQNECKKTRHNNFARVIHWKFCEKW